MTKLKIILYSIFIMSVTCYCLLGSRINYDTTINYAPDLDIFDVDSISLQNKYGEDLIFYSKSFVRNSNHHRDFYIFEDIINSVNIDTLYYYEAHLDLPNKRNLRVWLYENRVIYALEWNRARVTIEGH